MHANVLEIRGRTDRYDLFLVGSGEKGGERKGGVGFSLRVRGVSVMGAEAAGAAVNLNTGAVLTCYQRK